MLDICCGTGDLLLALKPKPAFRTPGARLRLLPSHAGGRPRRRSRAAAPAPCCSKPTPCACRYATPRSTWSRVAFGFRNLANYEAGLREMRRVLAPGGMAAILEFSQPPNAAFAALYNFYSRRILPWIGGAISGSRDAYTYLPESVRKFPSAEGLAAQMRNAGFTAVRYEYLTFGIVALHLGTV